jgi:hypothetical protein
MPVATLVILAMSLLLPAQTAGLIAPDLSKLAGAAAQLTNRGAAAVTDGARHGIHLDERAGEGMARLPGVQFATGAIDVDVRGKDVLQQSFLGIAFHAANATTYEVVYVRPFNFKSDDPARHHHAIQYMAHPRYTWQALRTERPEQFENAVSPAPDPNGWFHLRIVVAADRVEAFVNGTSCLRVAPLVDVKTGDVALWVGEGSGGDFANLQIRPEGPVK